LKFAVTDIETSGFAGTANKITEISILVFDGEKLIDEFTTLVNPECGIPYQITALTGINDQMVKDAPKFYDIAKQVFEITQDCIFVAHSVNFDYGIIQKEFKALGGDFKRKKLCTVRYARKALPGYASYSLGNICADLNIPIAARHRARGDAEATVELLRLSLVADADEKLLNGFLNIKNKEATLPPNLDAHNYSSLPQATGVYYFKSQSGEVIYIGKAKNIKQRINSHFHTKTIKAGRMLQEVYKIDFALTGSELVALLKESADIKHFYPKYNRAQKHKKDAFGLVHYESNDGVLNLGINNTKFIQQPIKSFRNQTESHEFMLQLIAEFGLCPKYCGVEKVSSGACFSYQLKKCLGVCCGQQAVDVYNIKVQKALASLQIEKTDRYIVLEGRTEEELSFVKLSGGMYLGYGFAPKNTSENALDEFLIPQVATQDATNLILSYLSGKDMEE